VREGLISVNEVPDEMWKTSWWIRVREPEAKSARKLREARRSWRELLYCNVGVRVRESDLKRSEKWSERSCFQKCI
jgi:hypothetical protein